MKKITNAVWCRLVKDCWKKLSFWLICLLLAINGAALDRDFMNWIYQTMPAHWQFYASAVILFARIFTFVRPKEDK